MSEAHKTAFAIAAHPDDIEFMMAGTLLLLGEAGYELHYMTVANGSCGTAELPRARIVKIRTAEARAAAAFLGAAFHASLLNDIEILYERKTLARLAAIIRKVNPGILLVPAPEDYMEDHANTSRLAATAAFCRGMRNFPTIPATRPVAGELTVYHALPYGLRDGLGRRVRAGYYVDVTSAMDRKRLALSLHKSQKEWLDKSQGVDAYLDAMRAMAEEVGRMSGRFAFAEGWRRHNSTGFCAPEADPLRDALGPRVLLDRRYGRGFDSTR